MFSLNSLKNLSLKGLKHSTSYVRAQDAATAPARHTWETGSLNWVQFMFQWFIRFSEFNEFNKISDPFRENSIAIALACSPVDTSVLFRNITFGHIFVFKWYFQGASIWFRLKVPFVLSVAFLRCQFVTEVLVSCWSHCFVIYTPLSM